VQTAGGATDMTRQLEKATEEQCAAADNISRNIDCVATISASTATDIEHARNAMMILSNISNALFAPVAQFRLARAV
jgi:methyl-accepting chemotaxis protein